MAIQRYLGVCLHLLHVSGPYHAGVNDWCFRRLTCTGSSDITGQSIGLLSKDWSDGRSELSNPLPFLALWLGPPAADEAFLEGADLDFCLVLVGSCFEAGGAVSAVSNSTAAS